MEEGRKIESQNMILVRKNTDTPVRTGARGVTFRGEPVEVTGGKPPSHPGSSGKVFVTFCEEEGKTGIYFPSIFGMEWVHKADWKRI